MQDRRGEIGSADATSSISPKVFLFASFLELSNQLLAEVLAHESAPVEDREAAYLAALGRFGEMADSSRRGTELLEQGAELFLCFCRGHDSALLYASTISSTGRRVPVSKIRSFS